MISIDQTCLRSKAYHLGLIGAATLLGGCASLGSSGPSAQTIASAIPRASAPQQPISVIELDSRTAQRVMAASQQASLAASLGDGVPFGARIGRGDVLDISIWEAPPAVLFAGSLSDGRQTMAGTGVRGSSLPELMVDPRGFVTIPFAGSLAVLGKTPPQVERDIIARLDGIAHQPQVIVRVTRNATASVTVVGDIANSARVPLTPKGERLLDIIAAAGGVRQPVGKTVVQISRGAKSASLPLERVIADPSQNIRLQADDVVTALFQPYSFTALGAVGANAEIPFEATGITLAQALGRMGGLRDDRANIRGVFIFRLEDPNALDSPLRTTAMTTPDGKVPVIYRADLKRPATFFAAQGFPIRNKDIVYISNAPGADLQKFINMVSSMTFSIIGISNAL